MCSHYLKCIIPVTATSRLLKKRQENRGKFLDVSEKLKKPGGMTKSLSGTENTAAIAARLLRVICNVTFHKFIRVMHDTPCHSRKQLDLMNFISFQHV